MAGTDAPTYPLSQDALLGDLTIELSNGFTTNVPHYEMVSQVRRPNKEGTYVVTDPTQLQLAVGVNDTNQTSGSPSLGGIFLSQVYLMVDYESGTFSLAPAVVGDPVRSRDVITIGCNATSNSTPSSTSNASSAGSSSTIIGFAVAFALTAVIALAIVGVVLWMRHLHGRLGKERRDEEQATPESPRSVASDVTPARSDRGWYAGSH